MADDLAKLLSRPDLVNALADRRAFADYDPITTADVLASMPARNPLAEALLGLKNRIPENPNPGPSLMNMARGGLGTAANWLAGKPEIGPDTIAPLGLSVLGLASRGALAAGAARRERAAVSADPVPPQFRGRAPESPVQPGTRDDTGAWFLEGEKPIYGNGSRQALDMLFGPEYAKRFDAFRRIDVRDADGNAHGYWVKPNLTPEQARAFNDLARTKRQFSPTKATDAEWENMHRLQGTAFGYSPEAIDAWITAGKNQ